MPKCKQRRPHITISHLSQPQHLHTPSSTTSERSADFPVVVEAKNKAAEVAGMNASKAKGAAEETAGQAKGKAAEVKGEAIGKKEEIKGKM
jgi:hypothetical protein